MKTYKIQQGWRYPFGATADASGVNFSIWGHQATSAELLLYEQARSTAPLTLGASHQTGWTGIIARTMHLFATSTAEEFLTLGATAGVAELEPEQSGPLAGAGDHPSR